MRFQDTKPSLSVLDSGIRRTEMVAWKHHQATYSQSSTLSASLQLLHVMLTVKKANYSVLQINEMLA